MIAALVLEPFALWLAERAHGTELPLAVTAGGRVLHANTPALAAGVGPGMRLAGALSRVPELLTVPLNGPALQAGWAELAEQLPVYSPRVELLAEGRALLTLTPAAGRELATALGGRVGLGASRELALLAALSGKAGEAVTVTEQDEQLFRQALPLSILRGVGLSAGLLERLHWLGLSRIGDLLKWSRAQQAAYLGPEFQLLKPYLHGARSGGVSLAPTLPSVRAELYFEQPLYEPGELQAAAADLAAPLLSQLAGRKPETLTVRARVAGLSLSATRHPKEDLRQSGTLIRAILRTLEDSGAMSCGVEALEVMLTSLVRPAVQQDLWNRAATREAAELAEQRFPGVMREVRWLDPYSLAPDTAYQWVSRCRPLAEGKALAEQQAPAAAFSVPKPRSAVGAGRA